VQSKTIQYFQALHSAGFKTTRTTVSNQWAKTALSPEDVAVVYLSVDGSWKTYRRDGVENGRGDTLWELEALL